MIEVDDVLLTRGERLTFETGEQLGVFLDYVRPPNRGWTVPPRNNGRTTAHRERDCLQYFLDLEAGRFAYPLSVEKTERPDFILTDANGARTGVEHTDAGSEALQRWLAHREDQGDEKGEEKAKENGSAHSGSADGDPAEGAGFASGIVPPAAFDEAAQEILKAYERKAASINKRGYHQADTYVLIVKLVSSAQVLFDEDVDAIVHRLPRLDAVQREQPARRMFARVLLILDGQARYWP